MEPLRCLSFSFLSELSQPVLDLIDSKGLAAFCTLVQLISQFVINEIIGEIDAVKTDRKVINSLEIFTLTAIAYKVILHSGHFYNPPIEFVQRKGIKNSLGFNSSIRFLQYFFT